jgi:hypothetical protein
MSSDWRTSTLPSSFDEFENRFHASSPQSPRARAVARAAAPSRQRLAIEASRKALLDFAGSGLTKADSLSVERAVLERARNSEEAPKAMQTLNHFLSVGKIPPSTRERAAASTPLPRRHRLVLPPAVRDRLSALPQAVSKPQRCQRSSRTPTPGANARTRELAQPKQFRLEAKESAFELFRREERARAEAARQLKEDCRKVHLPLSRVF